MLKLDFNYALIFLLNPKTKMGDKEGDHPYSRVLKAKGSIVRSLEWPGPLKFRSDEVLVVYVLLLS